MLSKLITAEAMKQCLQFVYTGNLDEKYDDLQVNINFSILCPSKKKRVSFYTVVLYSEKRHSVRFDLTQQKKMTSKNLQVDSRSNK